MAAKRTMQFALQSIGHFVVESELSEMCIVAVDQAEDEAPSTSAAAKKKQLIHPWDWVKKTTKFEGSILGYEVFVPKVEAVLREALEIRDDAKFRPGARFQKNSDKEVSFSFFSLRQNIN